MKDSPPLAKRRRYDAAFRAEALRLAGESRSTQAAARALNISPKLLYKWQKEALTPVAAARGAALDPVTAAKVRQLRAANRRQAQELEILKKPSPSSRRHRTIEPLASASTGPAPMGSCTAADCTCTASGKPSVSTTIWRVRPATCLPASWP